MYSQSKCYFPVAAAETRATRPVMIVASVEICIVEVAEEMGVVMSLKRSLDFEGTWGDGRLNRDT